ncbi:MAG: Cof-type HAD-IIB family hydrolase [Clostridiales bacterium]|nr:Cof-type HAD-IIB family hydrolase [Clostridiales bacterium]
MTGIKLIITDLDNTIVRRDNSISDYTCSVLRDAKRKGISIAFATSRSESASARFIRAIEPDMGIYNGGALVKRGSQVLSQVFIPEVEAKRIIGLCLEEKIISMTTTDGYFSSEPIIDNFSTYIDYADGHHIDFRSNVDLSHVYKITVYSDRRDALLGIADSNDTVALQNFVGESWYQFRPISATKESAIQLLGYSPIEIAAFGDDSNDIGMLKYCGTSVAMGNAIPECKAISGYVCGDCKDDGVAHWIIEHLL